MSENTKVVIRVEYERDGKKRVCFGEIEEKKLEALKKHLNQFTSFEDNGCLSGEEDFICMENDDNITWLDKKSLLTIETLGVTSAIDLKPRITDYFEPREKISSDSVLSS